MKNQHKIIKSFKPKDLIKLIVDNSNYKDIPYNWKFINCSNEDTKDVINKWTINQDKWNLIQDLELTFVEQDTNSVTIVYVSKDKIEEFMKNHCYKDLIELESYSFEIIVEIDNALITLIKIVANKETIDTTYDNNKFTF